MKIGEGITPSINRLVGRGRLKFIAIAAGVAVAIVLGPAIIESNEYLRSNYGGFVSWKGGLFGLNAVVPEPVEEVQQEPVDVADTGRQAPVRQDVPPVTDVQEEESPAEVPEETEPAKAVVLPSEFSNENFGILQASPDNFAGYKASISGQVYNIVDQSTSDWRVLSLRMFVKAQVTDEAKAVVILQMPKKDPAAESVALEGCVVIEGTVRGSIGDSDALGRSIKVPLIDSSTVREIECIDSAMPAFATKEVEISQSLNGVRLTAQKVQFAQDHARIKIAAENLDGGDGVFIREKESFAEFGGTEYGSISHLPVYTYYRLDSKLVAEYPSTNYLFFEPVEGSGPIKFTIVVEEVKVSETIRSVFVFTVE